MKQAKCKPLYLSVKTKQTAATILSRQSNYNPEQEWEASWALDCIFWSTGEERCVALDSYWAAKQVVKAEQWKGIGMEKCRSYWRKQDMHVWRWSAMAALPALFLVVVSVCNVAV